jgi:hypothetical protein
MKLKLIPFVLSTVVTSQILVSAATANTNCGENGHLMIYDIVDVQQVVQNGHNMLTAQEDGTFSNGWTFGPSERGCTDTEFHNFVLRHEDGTQVEKLSGVNQIGELVTLFSTIN